MATMRNLPDAHPIHKLLRPHLKYTLAINTRARATLISPGGAIDAAFGYGGDGKVEIVKRASKFYTVDITNIKESIAERGLENLPKFYYRDDGFKLWDIFEALVSGIVDAFYASDAEVGADEELQQWAGDLYENGFPSFQGSPQGRGFPQTITTKADLVKQSTRIMFTGSVQHAAVNFGQYIIYSYVPNAPLALRQAPPTAKGESTYSTLIKTLPDEQTAVKSITVTYALSQYSPDEVCVIKSTCTCMTIVNTNVFFSSAILISNLDLM